MCHYCAHSCSASPPLKRHPRTLCGAPAARTLGAAAALSVSLGARRSERTREKTRLQLHIKFSFCLRLSISLCALRLPRAPGAFFCSRQDEKCTAARRIGERKERNKRIHFLRRSNNQNRMKIYSRCQQIIPIVRPNVVPSTAVSFFGRFRSRNDAREKEGKKRCRYLVLHSCHFVW